MSPEEPIVPPVIGKVMVRVEASKVAEPRGASAKPSPVNAVTVPEFNATEVSPPVIVPALADPENSSRNATQLTAKTKKVRLIVLLKKLDRSHKIVPAGE